MFDSKTKIVSGPSVPPIFNSTVSLGHVMLHCLSRNPSFICQVNYDDGVEISCKEMKLLSIRAAQNLTKFGLKFNDEVGFLTRNSTYVLPMLIGCFTMGFPISPLHVIELEELFPHYIKYVKPKIWFCENEMLKPFENVMKLHNYEAVLVSLDERIEGYFNVADFLKETGEEDEFIPPAFEDNSKARLAVYSTSGSTGVPKSAEISHAQFINSYVREWEMNTDEVYFSLATIAWISGTNGILASIVYGCKRIITKKMDFDATADLIEKHKVTVMLSAPTVVLPMTEYLSAKKMLHKLNSLKLITFGGSIVTSQMREKIKRQISIELGVVYAMTETASIISLCRVEEKPTNSVGKLMANHMAKIVDSDGNALDFNKRGEIIVKTRFSFLGYCGNEEKTKQVLSEDGWYSTGDIGYFDENLNLYVCGRIGDNIKYNGTYVIFDDVESCLNEMNELERCVIVGIPDKNTDNEIPTIVATKSDPNVTELAVLNFLSKHFPEKSEIFNKVFFMDALPATITGKIQTHLIKKTVIEQEKY